MPPSDGSVDAADAALASPAASEQRCPRCGGVARERRRRQGTMNPFLPKKESCEITCEDCGLDFTPPGRLSEPISSSKLSPWDKP